MAAFLLPHSATKLNQHQLYTGRYWHIYLYEDGVISFTVTARRCLHRSFSTKSTNLSRSSKRKKHRPAAIATDGSSATTVVQAAGMDLNFAAASWK
jgi:hypothetical protein